MKDILKGQIGHFSILFLLLMGLCYLYHADPSMEKGAVFGVSTRAWFIVSVCIPVVHQFYVMVLWRLELFHKTISRTFGNSGFFYFKVGFTLLILLRPVSIIILALSNSDSMAINPIVRYLGALILVLPGIYLGYSIKRYFGIDRAFGKDHFYPNEAKDWPLVNQGIFKYASNSMYVFGFMALWVPGLVLESKAALAVAFFSHVYIWVHYYFTEKPDMELIYGV